jgi:NADH-quinone oxidoreductase subunit J
MSEFPAGGYLVNLIFIFALATTLIGAVIAVVTHRIIRSVCGLAICCMGLAGLYYFLHSPFLALMEILIYVGAVCVTIVFAIMLAEPEETSVEKKKAADAAWSVLALAVCGAIFFGLWRLGVQHDWTAPVARTNDGSIKSIGVALLSR